VGKIDFKWGKESKLFSVINTTHLSKEAFSKGCFLINLAIFLCPIKNIIAFFNLFNYRVGYHVLVRSFFVG
jgi:hypothetical protein